MDKGENEPPAAPDAPGPRGPGSEPGAARGEGPTPPAAPPSGKAAAPGADLEGNRFQSIARWVGKAWSVVGMTLILLLVVDVVLGRYFKARDWNKEYGAKSRLKAFEGEGWARKYWMEERDSSTTTWEPYVIWRHKPFSGEHVNFDGRGLRRTWNRTEEPDGNARTVFFFGGSAVLGVGSRDEETVPSHLSRALEEQGVGVKVVNYGESGYVMQQELLALMRELQEKRVPDLAIFYNGFNDVYASFQNGRAGWPMNVYKRKSIRLNDITVKMEVDRGVLLKSVFPNVTRLGARLSSLLAGSSVGSSGPGAGKGAGMESRPPELARDSRDQWLSCQKIVRLLAKEYGFRCLFYLQPLPFFKDSLTPDEQSWVEKEGHLRPHILATFEGIREAPESKGQPDFADLSGFFKSETAVRFIDQCHTTEEANGLVAKRIAKEAAACLAPPR